MVDLHVMRTFRLREGGVECDARGLSVGSVTLLCAAPGATLRQRWSVRAEEEINRELSSRYGLPVDVSSKMRGLQSIAEALNDGDLARAGIAALMLRFPDPPSLPKGAPDEVLFDLATALWESGVLKADWDPTKHPRTGAPPNPGWFAPVGSDKPIDFKQPESLKEPEPAQEPKALTEPVPSRELVPVENPEPSARWTRKARKTIEDFGRGVAKKRDLARLTQRRLRLPRRGGGRAQLLLEALEALKPTELNAGEPDRDGDAWRASFDPPKTLEDLQAGPTENFLGYDHHHMVEQNPANVEKIEIIKFTQEKLDDPSNMVWIPRLQHEWISAWYSGKYPDDPQGRTRRQVYSEMSFAEQRAVALHAMWLFGVLKDE